jgi:DNA-binding MarR family transcriptional regulator
MALLQGQGRALQQGRGLARGKVLARAAGLELSLEDGADQVQVTLRVAPLLRFRAEGELRQRLPPGEREARVLTHLHAVGKSRIRVLAETLEMKPATLRATLAALEKAGRVVRTEREPRSPKQAWKLSAAERRRFATDAAENQES